MLVLLVFLQYAGQTNINGKAANDINFSSFWHKWNLRKGEIMLFSLSDLCVKLQQQRWGGQINFCPSGQALTHETMTAHQDWL